jgi:hypothetical protein
VLFLTNSEIVTKYEFENRLGNDLEMHPTKKGIVTIPHPKKDIPKGTVANILRQAGL